MMNKQSGLLLTAMLCTASVVYGEPSEQDSGIEEVIEYIYQEQPCTLPEWMNTAISPDRWARHISHERSDLGQDDRQRLISEAKRSWRTYETEIEYLIGQFCWQQFLGRNGAVESWSPDDFVAKALGGRVQRLKEDLEQASRALATMPRQKRQ